MKPNGFFFISFRSKDFNSAFSLGKMNPYSTQDRTQKTNHQRKSECRFFWVWIGRKPAPGVPWECVFFVSLCNQCVVTVRHGIQKELNGNMKKVKPIWKNSFQLNIHHRYSSFDADLFCFFETVTISPLFNPFLSWFRYAQFSYISNTARDWEEICDWKQKTTTAHWLKQMTV